LKGCRKILPAGQTLDNKYMFPDHLSPPRMLTRASDNKMVRRWDSADPFGLDPRGQNSSRLEELIYNPRFPGKMFDRETNNHYNYFRDYDPQAGRYVQSDPIGLAGGINTYSYVLGNPLRAIDPLGLASCAFSFSAGRVVCTPDNANNSPVSIPAASGNNGGGQQCRNNPACTGVPNHGPTPTGCWRWTNGVTGKPNVECLSHAPVLIQI
jgi:RHS repeat-associated protein